MERDPIIAVDFTTKEELEVFLSLFKDEKLFLKIGMSLFYKYGPAIVKDLKSLGHKIFLDLKVHDIPNTAKNAMKDILELEPEITTVHAMGGFEMLQSVCDLRDQMNSKTKIFAVTQLTSTSEEEMRLTQLVNPSKKLIDSVLNYAKISFEAGIDGVVSSAFETSLIKENFKLLSLTPGIRLSKNNNFDQKRVVTPIDAKRFGSDYIVVGRPILQAPNPYEAYLEIKENWNQI